MYLDPGFGGMLFQILVAVAAMGGAILYSLRKKLLKLFSKSKDSGTQNQVSSRISNTTDDVIDMLQDDTGQVDKA